MYLIGTYPQVGTGAGAENTNVNNASILRELSFKQQAQGVNRDLYYYIRYY